MASPGNLSEDREKVSEIVKKINLDNGQREGFVAEIVSWETHTRPAAGEYAQAVINDQFPDDIDIFLGMMGSYFGTPTKHWGSGTEEEFQIAYESWKKVKTPEIMFYFSDAMSSLSQIDPEQLSKRNSFREGLGKLGVYYFVYTDVVEFQFDLYRHISSTIHEILKGKEAGKSEEAIPQESAISLKNYSALLAQDPLLNAVSMLDKATDHLNASTNIQTSLIGDVGKLSRGLVKESRNLQRANSNGKPEKAQMTIGKIYDIMSDYSKKLTTKVPKFSTEFSASILACLRVVSIVKDNDLEDTMPLTGLISNVDGIRTSFLSLIDQISSTDSEFDKWPDDILDIKIQKQIVIALHQDLASSIRKAVELLDRLKGDLAG